MERQGKEKVRFSRRVDNGEPAETGISSALGAEGRRFKSGRPDHIFTRASAHRPFPLSRLMPSWCLNWGLS